MFDLESKRFVRSRNVIFHESKFKFHSFKSVNKEAVLKEDSEISERSDEDGQFTVIQIDPTISEHIEDTPEVGAVICYGQLGIAQNIRGLIDIS